MTFAFATRAFAYLDPGTGNALLAVLASIIAAVVFALQGLFYKLTGKNWLGPLVLSSIYVLSGVMHTAIHLSFF